MKIFIQPILWIAITTTAMAQQPNVRLSGQLKNMGTQQVTIAYNGAASVIGDSKDITITTDENGNFDTTIYIPQPGYYNIYRNTLYLTPGDDIQCYITPNNSQAVFKGKGAEANNYLKDRLFPHAGSYLEGGTHLKKDYKATLHYIDSMANQRQQQLNELPNTDQKFKELETARIEADYVNSILYYPSYSLIYAKTRQAEMTPKTIDKFLTERKEDVATRIQHIVQDKFLDVAAVRNVIINLMTDTINNKGLQPYFNSTPRMKEMITALKASMALRRDASDSTLLQANMTAERLKNEDFANELRQKVAQARKLEVGMTAYDFTMKDAKGNIKKLSDFKGKVIYIDFWATWCGPCIQEAPHFEALSKEFNNKDIVFLQVSTDKNSNTWKQYIKSHGKTLPQYNSVDPILKDKWAIFFIPRFVIIDKNFNIVNPYAPRPSEKQTKELLKKLL